MALLYRGLDLASPEQTTPEEVAAWADYYTKTKGYPLPAFDFWIENRPDVLKRYALQARHSRSSAWGERPEDKPNPFSGLMYLHYYAITGYEDGILYEVLTSRWAGATKAQVLETLAVAFLHGGPFGMRFVATSSRDYLREWVEEDPDAPGPTFYSDWIPDPDAFKSGLDFNNPELADGEVPLIEGWYDRVCGEIPRYVSLLIRERPRLLKAYRSRFENAIRGALPPQAMPYYQLQWNVARGFDEGIRESVLMGRGLGMTKEQLIDAIGWGMLNGGPAAISVADRAVGDILSGWDE